MYNQFRSHNGKEVLSMPEEFKPGCQRPPIKKPAAAVDTATTPESSVQEAPAYYNGKFMNIGLSEYKGKWVLLCFYPGDFTFV
jgi:peroxiredoxin (alkyl hydroperoxide reductase subunit C)